MSQHGFSTKAIHAGQHPDQEFGAVIPPIYLTSTYAQEYPGKPKKYDYSRAGNPNFANLETVLAELEHGQFATVFNAGLGAVSSILNRLSSPARIVSIDDVYGGTFRLMNKIFGNFQFHTVFGDVTNETWLREQLQTPTALVWVETPTNPLLKLADIEKIAQITHDNGATLVVDNTFASPYFQNPLLLGADLVLHSSTKYLGGHSDIIGGAVVTNDQGWKEHLDFSRMAMGFNPSPFDAWLTQRSIKTLAIRMRQHQQNALELAKRLEEHPKVKKVIYPGLPSHPQHALAQKQMKGYSGIISVVFALSLEQTKELISSCEVFTLAESLGAVESLINHPASMTHASIPRETRIANGLEDGLVRLSIGLEEVIDLWKDLEQSLSKVG